MGKPTYEVLKARPTSKFPLRDVARVRDGGKDLLVSAEAFGPSTYVNNIIKMGQTYARSDTLEPVTFRLPTTDETMMIAAGNISEVKPKILDKNWLQAGRSVLLPGKRLVVNPPMDGEGKYITDERVLAGYINNAEEVGGVRFGRYGFAYVEKFDTGEMSVEQASENGLVRAIEGSRGRAEDMLTIGTKNNYLRGVRVWGLDNVNEAVTKVVSLSSSGVDMLSVGADDRDSYYNGGGFVFGVASKNQ